MLETIGHTFSELHYQYTEQFLLALLPMVVTVILHAFGMRCAGLCYRRFGSQPARSKRSGPHVVVVITIVVIMLLAHFLEVSAWAIFYFLAGMLDDFRTAMFYSINGYTTLGASNITMTGRWKGIDGFEAMTAMLMFGWSTAVLAAVVQKIHSLDD
jgi:hypothetical protein